MSRVRVPSLTPNKGGSSLSTNRPFVFPLSADAGNVADREFRPAADQRPDDRIEGSSLGTFKADLEQLEKLGQVLHDLADQAAGYRTGPAGGPFISGPGGIMSSVSAASLISGDLIDRSLVPAIKERLGETGDVMVHVAREFKNQDEASAGKMADIYTHATGDWNAEEPPA